MRLSLADSQFNQEVQDGPVPSRALRLMESLRSATDSDFSGPWPSRYCKGG